MLTFPSCRQNFTPNRFHPQTKFHPQMCDLATSRVLAEKFITAPMIKQMEANLTVAGDTTTRIAAAIIMLAVDDNI